MRAGTVRTNATGSSEQVQRGLLLPSPDSHTSSGPQIEGVARPLDVRFHIGDYSCPGPDGSLSSTTSKKRTRPIENVAHLGMLEKAVRFVNSGDVAIFQRLPPDVQHLCVSI